MKVKRTLIEASRGEISEWKDRWNEGNRPTLVKEILDKVIPISKSKTLQELGDDFLVKWVSSMKLEELGRDNNEFITLLKEINGDSLMLKSSENFTKVYNSYANNLFEDWFFKPEYLTLLFSILDSPDLYKYNQKDVNFIFDVFGNVGEKFGADIVANVLFTGAIVGGGYELDTIANIKDKLNKLNRSSSKKGEQIKLNSEKDFEQLKDTLNSAIKNPEVVSYIKDLIKKNNL